MTFAPIALFVLAVAGAGLPAPLSAKAVATNLLPREESNRRNQGSGTSSIALISGFSTMLVKVMVNFPLVTSTGTVSM